MLLQGRGSLDFLVVLHTATEMLLTFAVLNRRVTAVPRGLVTRKSGHGLLAIYASGIRSAAAADVLYFAIVVGRAGEVDVAMDQLAVSVPGAKRVKRAS